MRISDWSSDVCSSDLPGGRRMSGPEENKKAEKSLAELLDQDEAGADDIAAVLRLIAERAGKIIIAYYVEAAEIEVREKDDALTVNEAEEDAESFITGTPNTLTPDRETVVQGKIAE